MAVALHNENPSKALLFEHFSCTICLDILKKPVQCQRNEHYFCRSCITEHLKRSQRCPLCTEKLTMKTLRAVPRVFADLLSQFKAPVLCSNEGCGEMLSRQDQASHEESCKFRKTNCEDCDEEMRQRDYGKHSSVMRKELDELKLSFTEMSSCLKEMQEKLEGHREPIKAFQVPVKLIDSSPFVRRNRKIVNGQIIVAGGCSQVSRRSYEVLNWSTKSWTLFENALFFHHEYSFSFPFNNNIMICGGVSSNRIDCLDLINPRDSIAFPACLPSSDSAKGVLCGNDIVTFGDSIWKTSLKPPYSSKKILAYAKGEERRYYGAERINENVVIVGGEIDWKTTDDVLLYKPVTNELMKLVPLPYKVSQMATVAYNDNIIILGGKVEGIEDGSDGVIMYNITNQYCKKLPNMLAKRLGCAAVIMGNVIVVIGGWSDDKGLKTAEYLVLGQDTWKELPSMHYERHGTTASVQV